MATKKEILEAMKDPDLLKEAGLQKVSDKDEEELFADIVVGDNDDISDVVKKINDRGRKQRKYLKDRETKLLKLAEEKATQPEADRKAAEVDSFLKEHPELSANKKLLDIVSPLYNNGMSLKEAYENGCKVLDLDVKTGKAPEAKTPEELAAEKKVVDDEAAKKKATEKKSALKTDNNTDTGLPPGATVVEGEDKPKTLRELISEQANDLAAKGENPWRDAP